MNREPLLLANAPVIELVGRFLDANGRPSYRLAEPAIKKFKKCNRRIVCRGNQTKSDDGYVACQHVLCQLDVLGDEPLANLVKEYFHMYGYPAPAFRYSLILFAVLWQCLISAAWWIVDLDDWWLVSGIVTLAWACGSIISDVCKRHQLRTLEAIYQPSPTNVFAVPPASNSNGGARADAPDSAWGVP
jgi:hypothetical protein